MGPLTVWQQCLWSGGSDACVAVLSLQGLDRVMTRYKVECTGCIYTAAMRLNTTTHVISTAEACHTPSEKINAAMQ